MNSKNLSAIAGIICISATLGCGDSPDPLSEAQRKAFFETGRSALNTNAATRTQPTAKVKQKLRTAAGVTEISENPSIDNIQGSISESDCEFSDSAGVPFSETNQSGSVDASLGGENCPLTSDFAIKFDTELTDSSLSVKADIKVDFKVKEGTDLFESLDVTETKVSHRVSLSANQNSETTNIEQSGSGFLISKENGRVEFESEGSGSLSQSGEEISGELELIYRLKFEEFTGELITRIEDGEETYTLNGEEVSAEEVMEYLGAGFGIAGSVQTGTSSVSSSSL